MALVFLAFACSAEVTSLLEREARFELGIGRLEDEMGLFSRGGVLPQARTAIAMRNGMIYVGSGASNKIMGFTSYGDLVRLIYEPNVNPQPVTLGSLPSGSEGGLLTRRAVTYSFGRLGTIAVDSRRYVYAEDLLPPGRSMWDDDLQVSLNRIILRFDNDGNPVDYIGQEGVGGTPFPYIKRITTTVRDELVVVTGTPASRFVHVFSPAGDPLTTVEIGRDRLPVPEIDAGYIPVLDDVIAGVEAYRIYVKVSYYRAMRDAGSDKDQGIAYDHTRIYWIDLHSGRYEGFMELPNQTSGDGRDEHFELVGVTRDEHLFLLSREDDARTRLVIMNDRGRVLRRRYLEISEVNLLARDFYLTHDGVLTALLGYPDRADVVWWRSDRLLPGR